MNRKFNYIVTMGCTNSCPITLRVKTFEWYIEDPNGKFRDIYRKIQDVIWIKVLELLRELLE